MADELPMLTTVDNPYNPFSQWDEWYTYDRQAGYFTSELLARVASTSDELSETDQELAITLAIDEIVRENVLGIYRKVLPTDNTLAQSQAAIKIMSAREAA